MVIVGLWFERVKHRFCFLVVGEQALCRKPPPHREGVFPSGEGQGVGQPRQPATYRQQATCPTDKTDPPRRSAEASTVSSAEPLTSRPCGHPSEGGEGLRKTERENPSHPQLKCKLRGLGYDGPSLAICRLDLRG